MNPKKTTSKYIIKLLNNKDKKNLKSIQRKMTLPKEEKQCEWNRVLRSHRGQKEGTQYFLGAERKESSTRNPIPSESILWEWRKIKTFPDEGKLEGSVTRRAI